MRGRRSKVVGEKKRKKKTEESSKARGNKTETHEI
jgi:hypothetical protein